jgi:hypothetical protein
MKATRRFVSYLELLQPRLGETADEIDVRVEVETEDDDEPDDDDGDEVDALEDGEAGGFEADIDPDGVAAATAEGIAPMGMLDDEPMAPRRRRVMIPDDPTILSYLLAGILQIEAPRRQALLEAATTEARLRGLLRLIDREVFLLERRLRFYRPEVRLIGPRRS